MEFNADIDLQASRKPRHFWEREEEQEEIYKFMIGIVLWIFEAEEFDFGINFGDTA